MKIAVVGQESAGVQTVRQVADSAHELVTVLTSDPPGDRRGVTVSAVARDFGVPILPSEHVRDPHFAAELRRREVDVLLNVHSLHLIHQNVLAAPRFGAFNLHPGPLPEYAGLNVPSWAIYRGEREHGVTLHWMAPQVDTGPIAFHARFPVGPQETGLSLSAKCVHQGLPLISQLFSLLAESPDDIPRIAQDTTHRSYFGRDIPHRGWMPWDATAERVVDFVRACDYGPWPSPWKTPRTKSRKTGLEIEISRVRKTMEPTGASPGTVATAGDGCALVATADEWVLVPKARIEGASVRAAEVLVSGDLLETG